MMLSVNRGIIALTLGVLASTSVPTPHAEPRVRIVDTCDGPPALPHAGGRPAWGDVLQQDSATRMREAAPRSDSQRAPAAPAGPVSIVNGFTLFMLTLVLAGIGVPLWSVWSWRGIWKILAAIPPVVVVFTVVRIVVDTARDSTSHNLWPFEILMVGIGALSAIGTLRLARRILTVDAVRQ